MASHRRSRPSFAIGGPLTSYEWISGVLYFLMGEMLSIVSSIVPPYALYYREPGILAQSRPFSEIKRRNVPWLFGTTQP